MEEEIILRGSPPKNQGFFLKNILKLKYKYRTNLNQCQACFHGIHDPQIADITSNVVIMKLDEGHVYILNDVDDITPSDYYKIGMVSKERTVKDRIERETIK